MILTREDYEARVTRLADGTSPDPDDDRRLVKLYERVGVPDGPQPADEPVRQQASKRNRRRV